MIIDVILSLKVFYDFGGGFDRVISIVDMFLDLPSLLYSWLPISIFLISKSFMKAFLSISTVSMARHMGWPLALIVTFWAPELKMVRHAMT